MPTIYIPDKICSHCGGTKWYTNNIRYWCYSRRTENMKALFKNTNKELYNQRRKSTASYIRQLEKKKQKRQEYRNLNPIIKPQPLTISEKSARYHAKMKNDFLYKEKNLKRAADWLVINKEKLMTSDKYAKRNLGENITPEQIERYIIYLKCLRQLKQIENEKESN